MGREGLGPPHDKYIKALENTRPIDVFNLDTPEGIEIARRYKKNGYWLSEMYEYMPRLRSKLKAVLKQLEEKASK